MFLAHFGDAVNGSVLFFMIQSSLFRKRLAIQKVTYTKINYNKASTTAQQNGRQGSNAKPEHTNQSRSCPQISVVVPESYPKSSYFEKWHNFFISVEDMCNILKET